MVVPDGLDFSTITLRLGKKRCQSPGSVTHFSCFRCPVTNRWYMGGVRLSLLFVFALSTILLAAQPVRSKSGNHLIKNYDQFLAFRDDYRTRKLQKTLKINRDSEFRLIVPNKCRNQGERELRQLAAVEVFEESYVYVPSLCLWIEAGYDETRNKVHLDSTFINRLLDDFDQLIVYHIHVGIPLQTSGYFPAYSDLVSLILINAKFFKQPKTQIIHRVVTNLGIIDYVFRTTRETNRMIKRIERTGLGEFVAQNLAYFYARDEYKERYYAKVHQCEHLIDRDRENISKCFPMKASIFLLTFRN